MTHEMRPRRDRLVRNDLAWAGLLLSCLGLVPYFFLAAPAGLLVSLVSLWIRRSSVAIVGAILGAFVMTLYMVVWGRG